MPGIEHLVGTTCASHLSGAGEGGWVARSRIGFAKSVRRVQTVVLILTGFLVLQAIRSVAIPYPEILKVVRSLSQMKTTE